MADKLYLKAKKYLKMKESELWVFFESDEIKSVWIK
jgi:hypothetical protein